MKTTIENYNGEKFELNDLHFRHSHRGYGQWHILCELYFEGQKRTFREHTTDSQFIDSISDMKADDATHEEIQQAYFNAYFDNIKEIILEWVEEVKEGQIDE